MMLNRGYSFSKTAAMAVVILASSIAMGQTNTGAPASPPSPNDISANRGASFSILYAPSEADDATYRADIAAAAGGSAIVDYFDATAGTPDAALLDSYDCVYTWANQAYSDQVLFGDRLADYVDAGGRVVLGVFTTYTSGNFLAGRIMTDGYSPVDSPTGNNHFSLESYAGDGTTQIHAGVTAYDSQFRDILELQGSGIQDGSYTGDAEIAHAYRPDFGVVYSNGSGASQLGGGGDWPLAIANACQAIGLPEATSVPALSRTGLIILVLLMATLAGVLVRIR